MLEAPHTHFFRLVPYRRQKKIVQAHEAHSQQACFETKRTFSKILLALKSTTKKKAARAARVKAEPRRSEQNEGTDVHGQWNVYNEDTSLNQIEKTLSRIALYKRGNQI